MGIQSSINSLLSQAQSLAAFYTGLGKVDKIVGDTTATKNEAQIQTDIAAGNAPMKDGKVDPDWLTKQRDEFYKEAFNDDGTLSRIAKMKARLLQDRNNNSGVQEYLKSLAELKNEVARKVAKMSVEERTNSINQSKADFNEHTANLIKKYGKGSGNP